MIKNVGLIGVGAMGEPMGESLLRAGYTLRVCAHRTRERVERLSAAGAIENKNPADAAAGSEVVVIMVPDAPQVEEAIFGPTGAATGLPEGGTIIDMSTISPLASHSFHKRLAACKLQMLDAPVSGGPARAKTGELTIMVGGEPAVFAACEPVLRAMGKPTLVGPAGMGETFKLVNQIIISNVMIANVEGLVFAKKSGADITLLRQVLGTATASNYLLDKWLPKAWFEDRHKGGFALDLLRKDLRAALEAAKAMDVPLQTSSLAYELYTKASEQGHGADDYSAVAEVYEREAGIRVVE
ncbi:MAG TPA: NAD(P)-dependent oxidoreductase [Candidatus Eremiobacteraceae bacterium]|nr:NAD(P)-dependent oxidoreductase [Candidatus Eremiobacteraceae bacterium]